MVIVPTYVVDSDLKLTNWLHNVSGNDYTHVYIAPGRWKVDHDDYTLVQKLDTIGTKTIEGADGSVICDDDSEYVNSDDENDYSLLSYNTLPTTKDYWIKGLHIEFRKFTYSYEGIIQKCANISNCYFYKVTDKVAEIGTGIGPGVTLKHCYNISNCTFISGFESTAVGTAGDCEMVSSCSFIYNCTAFIKFESSNVNFSDHIDASLTGFYDCTCISDCTVRFTENSIDNCACHQGPIAGCQFISKCSVFSGQHLYDADFMGCSSLTSCRGKKFAGCSCVRYCSNVSSNYQLQPATFERCYADNVVTGSYQATVPVANTVEGGFNLVAT